MSLVEEALVSQKKIWREIVQSIVQSRLTQSLPPLFPKRIILCGVGSSRSAADLVMWTLTREYSQKKRLSQVQVLSCSSTEIGLKVIPAQGDWVFAFSHRGRTEATLQALDISSRSGAFTILVAAQDVSPPTSVRFYLPTSPMEKCEPHTIGLTGAICAVTTLLLGNSASDQWNALSRQSDPNLTKLRTETTAAPSLLIGEWEGETLAREISLKLTEMAHLRIPVYGSEEFFHGPQVLSATLGESEKIWYVATRQDSRRNQMKPAYQTREPKDQSLGWVSQLVDLQWRCLALALNLGKNPDGIAS